MAKQPAVSTDSVAQDQIRAFVERILRMKEEAKAIKDDIREIYAEAKGNGFDKTVLGQVVSYVEKRAKDRDELLEREALFELYMSAFDGTVIDDGYGGDDQRPSHAHTREGVRRGWNVDENGDGPLRRMTKARQAIFDTLEVEGVIAGRDTGRCVYFLHAPEAGVLKIGSSDDVLKRVRGLQGASPVPLVLLGSIGGGLEHELELHGLFADRRVHGEWFTVDDEFLANIRWRIARDAREEEHHSALTHAADGADAQPVGTAEELQPGSSAPIQIEAPRGVEGEAEGASASPANSIVRFTNKPLRPHCMNPTSCGGYGRTHCGPCQKAHAAGGTTIPVLGEVR